MKPRTPTQFNAWISDELAWRKKELHALWGLANRKRFTELEQPILRGAVAVLYAHWEGFIKTSGDQYLSYVDLQKLTHSELTLNFVALCARPLFSDAEQSLRAAAHLAIVTFFAEKQSDRAVGLTKRSIDTGSNLKVDVLKNIIVQLGLTYRSEYALSEKPVIERLLQLRNAIAHGEFQTIVFEDYEQLHTRVIELLELFSNDLDNAVSLRKFRRIP